MFKDYSGGVIGISGRNRIRSTRRRPAVSGRELFPATRLMRNTIGTLLLLTLVLGIGSTVWYGLQVQVALDQIGSIRSRNNELHNENSMLVVKRDIMLTQDHMQEAGQKLGLRPPTEDQLRYP